MWTCPPCRVKNRDQDEKCEECGSLRPGGASATTDVRRCPFDGAELYANGWCSTGEGFPLTMRECPDACPHCRKPLSWTGDCFACLPSDAKPGHRYEDTGGHWRVVEQGPQPLYDAAGRAAKDEAMRAARAMAQAFAARTRTVARPVETDEDGALTGAARMAKAQEEIRRYHAWLSEKGSTP